MINDKSEIERNIAYNIARRRRNLRLSQQRLAELLKKETLQISYWERCVSTPDVCSLFQLCETLEISVVEMLGGDAIDQPGSMAVGGAEKNMILADRKAARIDQNYVMRILGVKEDD